MNLVHKTIPREVIDKQVDKVIAYWEFEENHPRLAHIKYFFGDTWPMLVGGLTGIVICVVLFKLFGAF